MSGARVVLITVSGPGGPVDIGVRSDVTVAGLAASLGNVIGLRAGEIAAAEHHAPPRPGVPQGAKVRLAASASLADCGLADGDMIIFRAAGPGAAVPAKAVPAKAVPAKAGSAKAESDEPAS